ncbi:tyrosine-type recombinase/integrase [soil metagenome]
MAQDINKIVKSVKNQTCFPIDVNQDFEEYDDPLQQFTYALRAPETKRQYPRRLKVFMDFVKLEGDIRQQARTLKEKIQNDKDWFRVSLIRFFEFHKERARRNDIAYATISNYFKAIKLFAEMNFDTSVVNWKKISKGIPTGRKAANDRAPTIEELKKLSEYPDRRIKPIVYLMVSTGIRLGAFDTMQWKHVIPIYEKEEIRAAKLTVYPGDNEEYFTFMTPEAYNSLKEWMDYRISHGEKITGESWLMRDLWQTTEMNYGAKFGVATYPKQLKSLGIKSLLERALKAQGLVKPLIKENKERRREWKGAHGLRKYYQTIAEQKMKSINVEILMGHSIGVTDSYYRPQEREILEDYLKASNFLSLDYDNITLTKHIKNLEEENKTNDYIIKGKLQEKDEEIKNILEKVSLLEKQVKEDRKYRIAFSY